MTAFRKGIILTMNKKQKPKAGPVKSGRPSFSDPKAEFYLADVKGMTKKQFDAMLDRIIDGPEDGAISVKANKRKRA